MIDIDDILPVVVAIAVAAVLFLAIITAIKQTMKPAPKRDTIDSRMQIKEQQWRMDDIRRRQKQLLRDQKQKIRDLRRR